MTRQTDDLAVQNAALRAELEDLRWVADKTNQGVKHLYRELEKQNLELKKVDQMKSEFISVLSHELRTPLAVIREGISQVVDGVHGPVAARQSQTLDLALKGADRLTRLVTDLLDLSKMESGKTRLKLESTDLAACVREAAANLQPAAVKKGIQIVIEAPKTLVFFADRDKLDQIMTNLLSNALKFTEKGSVTIRLKSTDREALLTVEDTGSGILPEDLPRVFSKFEQFSRHRPGAERGAGLGLAITKALVELHGGSIDVDSVFGRGTRFDIRMPRRTARDAAEETIRHARERAFARGTELTVINVTLTEAGMEAGDSSQPFPVSAEPILIRLDAEVRDALRRRDDMLIRDANCLWVLLPEADRRAAQAVFDRIRDRTESILASHSGPVKYRAAYQLTYLEQSERV